MEAEKYIKVTQVHKWSIYEEKMTEANKIWLSKFSNFSWTL